MDILKPYLEKLAAIIASQRLPLLGTFVLVACAWFYADLYLREPLTRYEISGFLIVFFLALLGVYRLLLYIMRLLFTLAVAAPLLHPSSAQAGELKVIDIGGTGAYKVDLQYLSLIRFAFPFEDLKLTNNLNKPESETNCISYRRKNNRKFKAEFCNYNKMFNKSISSIIVDSNGTRAYAYDLYDLYAGGGGNFGAVLELPSTDLRDYLTAGGFEIEGLSRAILPAKPTAAAYKGFGLYAFILFRDKGIDRARKLKLTSAYISILPYFSTDSFNVPRNKLGALMYPTNLSDQDVYSLINAGNNDGTADGSKTILEAYNYNLATSALKKLQQVMKKRPPSVSLVFVGAKSSRLMDINSMDWDNAFAMDISSLDDYDKFFTELINFFVYGIDEPPSDIFTLARQFAGSTGRLALVMFDGK